MDHETLLAKTIELTQSLGYQEALAQYEQGYDWQVRFSNSAQDIYKRWNLDNLEIFVMKDQKTTTVQLESPTIESVEQKLRATLKFLEASPPSQLYQGMEMEIKPYTQISGLFDNRSKSLHEQGPELVKDNIDAALNAGAKKVAGVFYFGYSNTALRTSHGFSGNFDSSYYRTTTRTFVDAESSGQDIICGRNLDNLKKKLITSGEKAGQIAKMAVNPRAGKAGKFDVILSPTVGGNVFGEITDGANPLMIMIGMSALDGKLGNQLGPESLNISSNGLLGEGLGSRPYDVEGTPTQNLPIFEKGKLVNLIQNTSSAKLYQTQSTGHSTFVEFGVGSKILAPIHTNTVYKPGDLTEAEIIAECQRPTIYFTSNWYTRFTNQLESSFSTIPRDGLFYVENGEIQYPIRNVRLSDNLLRMIQNIEHIGSDVQQVQWWEVQTPTFIPTIKVKDCTITAATK
ncbi:MAG: TldD/PmbA family protein [Promethearchaeota archaeon]